MVYLRRSFKKKTSLIALIFFITSIVTAQNNEQYKTNAFWDNVRFGGGFGLSTGNNFFSATIAPSAIYDFNNQFALGISLNGTYNRNKSIYKSTIFGGSVIGLFNPIEALQVSTEFEQLHVSRNFDNIIYEDENYWYPALFMGLGYRTDNITIGMRYDILYDKDKSIYADPWAPFVRIYF